MLIQNNELFTAEQEAGTHSLRIHPAAVGGPGDVSTGRGQRGTVQGGSPEGGAGRNHGAGRLPRGEDTPGSCCWAGTPLPGTLRELHSRAGKN